MIRNATRNGLAARYQETDVRGGLTRICANALKLSRLQGKLFLSDLTAWRAKLRLTIIAVVTGAILTAGSIPILVAGLAYYLDEWLAVGFPNALLIAGGGSLILGLLIALVGMMRISRSAEHFERSRTELNRNLAWLKAQFDSDPSE
jgi:hypothetical protein